jgi:hypothetical protein
MIGWKFRLFVIGLPVMIVILLPVQLSWRDSQLNGISLGGIANVWARAPLSVKKFGAKGDGVHDDSAAISAVFAAAQSGDVISFPAGVYICNGVNVANKSNLTLKGQGNSTIIRNGITNGDTPVLTFATVNGLTIQDLSFDNRSIGAYGGVRFYDTENVLINRTRFFDSAPLPLGSTDRYSYVFGNGSQPHKNIRITNNVIEDLQLEVDFGQGVTIQKNTLNRGVRTGAIGLFTIDDGVVLENYLIDGNTIIDPVGAGIAINIDPPDNINVTIRNITISNNTIIFNRIPTEAIHIGPGNNSVVASGNLYDKITIQTNLIQVAAGAEAQPSESALIKFNAGPNSALSFKNTTIAQNRIEGGGNPALPIIAMDIRYLENSAVTANNVYNLFTAVAFNRLKNTSIERNYVGQLADYFVYLLDNSRGGNLFRSNSYSGQVTTPLSYENGNATDVIFPPTLTTTRK